jgi:hypothetical protein
LHRDAKFLTKLFSGGGHSSPTTRAAFGSIFVPQKYGGFLTAKI